MYYIPRTGECGFEEAEGNKFKGLILTSRRKISPNGMRRLMVDVTWIALRSGKRDECVIFRKKIND